MEPGELYWDVIKPHWKRVTIYDGSDPFLREYARTPEAARNLLSAHWCQSEVCNGGLHQFFSNPTGVLAPEAAVGYDAIGLPGLGSVVQRAMLFFGRAYPRAQQERQQALQGHAQVHPDAWDPFEKLNHEFFDLLNQESGGWTQAADRYAGQHISVRSPFAP